VVCGSSFAIGLLTLAAITCDSADFKRVLRTDESQKRIFVSAQAKEIASAGKTGVILRRLQETVARCHPTWGQSWSISFFSSPKYAGYKDEPHLEKHVKDGSWAAGYLGEYERVSGMLTLHPANPAKIRTVKIPLP